MKKIKYTIQIYFFSHRNVGYIETLWEMKWYSIQINLIQISNIEYYALFLEITIYCV